MSRKSNFQLKSEGIVISGTAEELTKKFNKLADKIKNKDEDDFEKSFEIKSAAMNGLFCNYQYTETVAKNTSNTHNVKSERPVHEDITARFKALNPHLAVICEQVDESRIGDITKIEDFDPKLHAHETIQFLMSRFQVHAFTLSGEGDSKSVRLHGTRTLSNNKDIPLTTYAVKYDSEYNFLHDLIMTVTDLVDEVDLYHNGKQAPVYMQTKLPFD